MKTGSDEMNEKSLSRKKKPEKYQKARGWVLSKADNIKNLTVRDLLLATFKGIINANNKNITVKHLTFLEGKQDKQNCKACAATLCLLEILEMKTSQLEFISKITYRMSDVLNGRNFESVEPAMSVKSVMEKIERSINAFRHGGPGEMLSTFGSKDQRIFDEEVLCTYDLIENPKFRVAMQDNIYGSFVSLEHDQEDMRSAAKELLKYTQKRLPEKLYEGRNQIDDTKE